MVKHVAFWMPSKEDIELLLELYKNGKSVTIMATLLGRSEQDVQEILSAIQPNPPG